MSSEDSARELWELQVEREYVGKLRQQRLRIEELKVCYD
jgi:hypothetical protein